LRAPLPASDEPGPVAKSRTSGKPVLVLGLGSSGDAAARLLVRQGRSVVVVDSSRTRRLREKAEALAGMGVQVLLGRRALPKTDFETAVVSPGIRPDSPWMKDLAARNVPVMSEFEFGAENCVCPLLAVTGSNGKSTLVALCADILAAAGFRVRTAGNCEPPVSAIAPVSNALDWIVAEVSSFQLETARAFRPRVGVLINLNPNHLDRHGTMAAYEKCKKTLFAGMGFGDTAIVPERLAAKWRRLAPEARWVCFGTGKGADFRFAPGRIEFKDGVLDISGSWFDNPVMGLTAAAAAAATAACGAPASLVAERVRAFRPLPHRFNVVAQIRGVRFIDDSKATNLAAMESAVAMAGRNVLLIAGGLLKESGLGRVARALRQRVRRAYLIGSGARKLAKAWRGMVPCSVCGVLERAVREAWRDARPGDTILLSPGGASFDQFGSFEERGEMFRRLALKTGGAR